MKFNRFTKSIIILALSSLLLFVTSCKKEVKIIKPIEIKFKKEGELKLFKSTSDTLIATFNIEIADDDYETQRGMMDRKFMDSNNAMLFIFPDMRMRSFYMKSTLIPLDIIYLDMDNKIVSIQENAQPLNETSLPSEARAMYVLEINGGLSKQLSIGAGDYMKFTKSVNQ